MMVEVKITLKVGGREIEISEKEARELKGDLDRLFNQSVFPQLTWPKVMRDPFYLPYDVTCGGTDPLKNGETYYGGVAGGGMK